MPKGKLLLINPWICDFAAYSFWIEPIGFLTIASFLREAGYEVSYIDCLDRHHPDLLKMQGMVSPKSTQYATGKYHKEFIEKPEPLKHVQRRYGRYGITLDIFDAELESVQKPDVVLVTSKLTYWYLGVFEVIRRVKKRYPDVPLILGGTYATLCCEHAQKNSEADYVIKGEGELQTLKLVDALTGNPSDYSSFPADISNYPFPAHDLNRKLDYAAILTSRGCPMKCTYCAVHLLNPGFRQRSVQNVLDEILWCYHEFGTRNFAFYDDALLLNPKGHIHRILDGIIERKLQCYFHTPNSMHAQLIDAQLAHKMYQGGFKTVRISLETSDMERQKLSSSGKVSNEGFRKAAENLLNAGFTANEVGAYVMIGLPGQTLQEVKDSVAFVHDCGIQVKLAQYTPIPGTAEWQRAVTEYGFDPHFDPVLHNNSIFPIQTNELANEDFETVKMLVKEGNKRIMCIP